MSHLLPLPNLSHIRSQLAAVVYKLYCWRHHFNLSLKSEDTILTYHSKVKSNVGKLSKSRETLQGIWETSWSGDFVKWLSSPIFMKTNQKKNLIDWYITFYKIQKMLELKLFSYVKFTNATTCRSKGRGFESCQGNKKIVFPNRKDYADSLSVCIRTRTRDHVRTLKIL